LNRWDGTAWQPVANSAFSTIVKANETKTIVKTLDGRTFYFSEDFTGDSTALTTATAAAAAQGVYELHVGNTGYTTVAIPESGTNGEAGHQAPIPAKSFYYIKEGGIKVEIPLNDIVYQGITQLTTEQINNTKLKLGDNITNNTSVFTGDTFNVGPDKYYIYKGNFPTSVNANAATTTGTTIDKPVFKILSMHLSYAGGVSANVTDLVLTGANNQTVAFNVGTGKMYQVLGTSAVAADVIVEFASTQLPVGVVVP